MKQQYRTVVAFAHAVRYQDAMLRAWMARTKQGNGYRPEDVPPYIDTPTNDDRGRAELIRFRLQPLTHGESYMAYLTHTDDKSVKVACDVGVSNPRGIITTWNGEMLAAVTRLTSYNAVCFGRDAGAKGSFWARGIDGRTYYGRHNGKGMSCTMRLARWTDEFEVQQFTTMKTWECVHTTTSVQEARHTVQEYRANQPWCRLRIQKKKVRQ